MTIQMANPNLVTAFRQLAEHYARLGDIYRGNAFNLTASIIDSLPEPITNPVVQLKGIRGIGQGSIDRATEFLQTGQLSELTSSPPVRSALEQVYGIGPVRARAFESEGITTVEDLAARVENGTVSVLPNTAFALKWFYHLRERIPREEVAYFGVWLCQIIRLLDPTSQAEVVGSYRRGLPTSGDIDIVFTSENSTLLGRVINYLRSINFIQHIFSLGPVKFQGAYMNTYPESGGIMRKFDIRYVPPEAWPTSLLHATGSDSFNVMMRREAIQRGLMLSEHGLFNVVNGKPTTRIPTATEADVFRVLGMSYLSPDQRDLA